MSLQYILLAVANSIKHIMAKLSDMEGFSPIGILLSGLLMSTFIVIIYRLYFSPLARFPGPKLAALSRYYEFHYDFFKQGHYEKEIASMHDKYGECIRT